MRLAAIAAMAALAMAGMTFSAPAARADGIEPPPQTRPAPRPRARPTPAPRVAPPVIRESAPVPLAPPAPVYEEAGVRLSDGFFYGPLTGGVGAGVNSNAVGGGGGVVIVGGGTRFSGGAGRTMMRAHRVSHGGGSSGAPACD